jgi:hypothetical protein
VSLLKMSAPIRLTFAARSVMFVSCDATVVTAAASAELTTICLRARVIRATPISPSSTESGEVSSARNPAATTVSTAIPKAASSACVPTSCAAAFVSPDVTLRD